MKRIALLLLVLLNCLSLVACGADGDPVQPTANVGVGVSNSGIHTGASIGLNKGPWNVSWGRYF